MNRRAGAALALAILLGGCSDSITTGSQTPLSTPSISPSAAPTARPTPGPTVPEALPTAVPPSPAPTQAPSPAPTETAEGRQGLEWEDLENLHFEVDGQAVQLEQGRAMISYGGASTDQYTLQNRVGQGDLNGDGHDDVVAHIVMTTGGTGVFHLIVPVIDDGQGGTAQRPVWVGDRIVVESMAVRDGLVGLTLLDREPNEPYTVLTRRQTLELDFSQSEPVMAVVDSQPLESLPPLATDLADIAVQFDPGEIGTIVAGSIEFRQRQTYTAQMSAGQPFAATLEAPIGVWLDVRLGDHVVAFGSDRLQSAQAELPATGTWEVTVVSSHAARADYRLSIQAMPLESDPSPAPTGAPVPSEEPPPPLLPDDTAPVMYLTFDDGPHPVYTLQVLDVLARYNIKATFFVLGSEVELYPGTFQRILDGGHTVGNHTWNHEALDGLPREEFDDTIGRTQALLGNRTTPCMRPPYGLMDAFTEDWAGEYGLDVVLWNVDPEDWRQTSALAIAQHLVDHAHDGAVILLHDGGGDRSATVLGLEVALHELSEQGFRFAPLCGPHGDVRQ